MTVLSIVRDAEKDPKAAFQSICLALSNAGLPRPAKPQVVDGRGKLNVAAFILPDDQTPGMLEDLCLRSVADDPVMRCVDDYFDCLKVEKAEPKNEAKARVQVFLASRDRPDRRLGEAADKGDWPWDSPAFNQVEEFLQSL